MRIRNLLIAILTVSSTVAFAQEQRQIKEEGKTVFKPHWFMQVQAGAAHTVGEADFTDLISPAAAVNVGYKFAPAFGARLGVSGWQAKAGWVTPSQTYQYKYLQGNLDLMADLSTLFCGFNPKRVFNGYISCFRQRRSKRTGHKISRTGVSVARQTKPCSRTYGTGM